MELGDIVYLKNIIFKSNENKHEIDHAFMMGRPCVYIGEYEDDMYFLPICTYSEEDKQHYNVIVKKNNHTKLTKESKINFSTIIKKAPSYYYVKGNIGEVCIFYMIQRIISFYKNHEVEYSDAVCNIINNYTKNNNIVVCKKKKKVKNNHKS